MSQYVSGTVSAKHFGDSVSKARGDGLDMCNGGIVHTLDKGCEIWSWR